MSTADERTTVVVVTGLSGAGKTTAVNALEDLGFACVDNVPSPVLLATLEALEAAGVRRIAFGIDVRVRAYLESAVEVLDSMAVSAGRDLQVLFLDCADELLVRRFSATRRPHPLSTVGDPATPAPAILDGITQERALLVGLRAHATAVIDSTDLSVHDLRRQVGSMFGGTGAEARLNARFVSFGFKYGPPSDADMIFDVRFLKNPYFEEALRPLSGLDEPVRDYILENPEAQALLAKLTMLLEFCLPRFEREGKSYLTVAIGCTGGRHRSVCLTEYLSRTLSAALDIAIEPVHRDIERAERGPGGASQRPLTG